MRGMGWSKGDNAKKILVRVGAGREGNGEENFCNYYIANFLQII